MDLNINLLADTDTLDLVQNIFVVSQDVQETSIDKSDENINIRNVGIKATERGIIKLSGDQRTFMWGTNDRKLMTVPFDENPYSALAAYFKTDEGVEVYQTIEKKLK